MLFQQPLDQAPHSSSCTFFLLPVYCAVFTKQIRQFLRDCNKLIMLIEIFDGLWFCESIVEGIYKISSFTIELANALLFCTDISDCRILVTSRTIRLIADSFFHQSMADIVSFTEAITASAISGYSERCLLTMLSTSGWGSSFTTLIFSLSVFSLEPTDTFSSNLSYDSTAPGSGSFRCCRYIS